MLRKLMWLAISLCATVVMAMPTPDDVSKSVENKDWPKAEAQLKEVLQAKPNSARARYQLGQIYSIQGRYVDALNELQQAKTIDPKLAFAANPQEFETRFSKVEAMVKGSTVKPLPATTSQAQSASAAPAPTPAPAGKPATNPDVEKNSVWVYVFSGIMVSTLIGWWIFIVRKSKANRKKLEEEKAKMVAENKKRLSELLAMANVLRDAELECKTAAYSTEAKDQILEKIDSLRKKVTAEIEKGKSGALLVEHTMTTLREEKEALLGAVKSGHVPEAKPSRDDQPIPYYSPRQSQQDAPPPGNVSYTPSHTSSFSGGSSGGSNDGLLTGVMLGSIMHGSSGRTTEVHHHHYESSRDRSDDDDNRRSSSSFDSGSSSSSWSSDSSSDSSSSSFDSGSGGGDY